MEDKALSTAAVRSHQVLGVFEFLCDVPKNNKNNDFSIYFSPDVWNFAIGYLNSFFKLFSRDSLKTGIEGGEPVEDLQVSKTRYTLDAEI